MSHEVVGEDSASREEIIRYWTKIHNLDNPDLNPNEIEQIVTKRMENPVFVEQGRAAVALYKELQRKNPNWDGFDDWFFGTDSSPGSQK